MTTRDQHTVRLPLSTSTNILPFRDHHTAIHGLNIQVPGFLLPNQRLMNLITNVVSSTIYENRPK